MTIYIWPNGYVSNNVEASMNMGYSDDFFTVSGDTPAVETARLLHGHFGDGDMYYEVVAKMYEFFINCD